MGKEEREAVDDFLKAADEKQVGLVVEFADFLKHNKKWWLTPIVLFLLLAAAFVVFGSSVVAPFIYPLF